MKRFTHGLTAILLVSATFCLPSRLGAQEPAKKEVKLEPAVLYTGRDGLANLAKKLEAGQDVNVVFLGGSITVGGASPNGYVTFVEKWLKEKYPNAKIHVTNSGISGTGSDFGDRRYDRDVLAKNPDLVVIEFCVNDGDSDQTTAMERMVHKTWTKNPNTDLIIFYTLDKRHLPYYQQGNLPPSASAHERVAAFYGIPSLGTGFNVATRVNSGEIPWEKFSKDGCHPSQDGYVYFDDVFAQALPELLKAAPPKAHELGKSITPNLEVYRPPAVAQPINFKGEFLSAKGEKAIKVYPLPIPTKNWVGEPSFEGPDGKTLWRISWLPRSEGGKFDPTLGTDKTKWETNSMVWFEGDSSFTGPAGTAIFRRNNEDAIIGISRQEIGIIRFIAPETGRYTVRVKSGPWGTFKNDDKSMSLSVLKFTWNGGPGELLATQKEVKNQSKGLAMELETKLLAGEELVFIPDTDAIQVGGDWPAFNVTVGFLGE